MDGPLALLQLIFTELGFTENAPCAIPKSNGYSASEPSTGLKSTEHKKMMENNRIKSIPDYCHSKN